MGVMDIVFFVLAGVAPMGVVVALTVLAIALGNGAGVPGTYLVAGIVLALFAIGYVRMSRRVTNAGAFYAYATKGLGHRVGGSTAYIAVLAYNAATIGILGALAFFANQVMNSVLRDRPTVAGMGADRVRDRRRPVLLRGHLQCEGARTRAAMRSRNAARLRRRRPDPQWLSRILA